MLFLEQFEWCACNLLSLPLVVKWLSSELCAYAKTFLISYQIDKQTAPADLDQRWKLTPLKTWSLSHSWHNNYLNTYNHIFIDADTFILSLIGENHNKQKYFDRETAIIPPKHTQIFCTFYINITIFFYHHNLTLWLLWSLLLQMLK